LSTSNQGKSRALNDIQFFDLIDQRWVAYSPCSSSVQIPSPRYAHISSVSASKLFIIGGKGLDNVGKDDIHVYDLALRDWVLQRTHPLQCDTCRSLVVTTQGHVEPAAGPRPPTSTTIAELERVDVTLPESLIHLPYSTEPTDDNPSDIIVLNNDDVCWFLALLCFADSASPSLTT
jgi:leucine-zipper-like transcriptional regulator 1